MLDLALACVGYPEVVEVSSVTRSNFGHREEYVYEHMHGVDNGPEGFDVDDSVTAFIRCAGGVTINLDVAWAANRRDADELIVRGTESGARLSLSSSEVEFYDVEQENDENQLPVNVWETEGVEGHLGEVEYFYEIICGDREHSINTIENGLQVQEVINAIYESQGEGKAVSLYPKPT